MCMVFGMALPMNLFNNRMLANVPRDITASLPRREPYELNSLGVKLRQTHEHSPVSILLCIFHAWDSSAEMRISAVLELNLVISVIRPDPRCFFNMGGGVGWQTSNFSPCRSKWRVTLSIGKRKNKTIISAVDHDIIIIYYLCHCCDFQPATSAATLFTSVPRCSRCY